MNECIVINLLIIGIVRGCVMCSEWYNCYISDIIVLCAMAGGGGGAGPGDIVDTVTLESEECGGGTLDYLTAAQTCKRWNLKSC